MADGTGHLAYYEQHNISPVRYRATDLDEHFDRRDGLYRSLGLPPVAIKGARALEVAAGSGQNSLYVATCQPRSFDLVEPNAAGRADIEKAYRSLERTHTKPTIHPMRLEAFQPAQPYDIVICENWLGWQANELAMLKKLGDFVAPGGVLVTTIVPFSGLFANTMRKLFSLRLTKPNSNFEEQTRLMVDVFGPHLSTMTNMTRSHEDWVHDCMVNPHFLNVVLPLDLVLQEVGGDLDILATFPRFDTDWRWFKSFKRDAWAFNERLLTSYRANILNFIDHTKTFAPLEQASAVALDESFAALHHAALDYQEAVGHGSADGARVTSTLATLTDKLVTEAPAFGPAMDELKATWSRRDLTPAHVRDMQKFGAVFGRELVYISLTRRRN